MPNCFVIQPFDGGPFDKRYEDVLEPAIGDAHLEAYRVDRDPNASIPIEQIESGIRNAQVCLADITTDNLDSPNDRVGTFRIRKDTERAGFTKIATTLALASLLEKGFVSLAEEYDEASDRGYTVYKMEGLGLAWLNNNQDQLQLKQED